jgi:hypothetical protein
LIQRGSQNGIILPFPTEITVEAKNKSLSTEKKTDASKVSPSYHSCTKASAILERAQTSPNP